MYLPARVRMQNVLIHGNSGAGKSMIIEKFIRSHSLELDREDAARPIVSMQMPPLPTLRSFFSELLRSLDCTVIFGSKISELEHDTLRQLKNARPRLLAIDEIHHLLACTPREQRAALNVLKFLSNELRVSIVALGTSEACMSCEPIHKSPVDSNPAPYPPGPRTTIFAAFLPDFFSNSTSTVRISSTIELRSTTSWN
jgi:hypothetical protein